MGEVDPLSGATAKRRFYVRARLSDDFGPNQTVSREVDAQLLKQLKQPYSTELGLLGYKSPWW